MFLLLLSVPGAAELGGNLNSVQADQVQLHAQRQVHSAEGYEVHELQSPSGTVVREYVSPEGTVFGIAWEGPWIPDMHQLLGPYFEAYARAAQNRSPRRGPLLVEQPDLVIEMSGRARSFSGRAFLPQAAPRNVTPKNMR